MKRDVKAIRLDLRQKVVPIWLRKSGGYGPRQSVADYLNRAADAIARMVGNKVIIILGRDAWPLVPLLRHRGVRTQYFLYSRLQIGDPSTKDAWLREVPRRSYVLDTGYAGSILDDIRKFDPTIKGILLSSSGNYPELDVQEPMVNRNIVDDIEHTPKIIGRSRGYRGPYALSKPENYGDDVGGKEKQERVVSENERLLTEAGLPKEVIDKYRRFSGIPPKDRIGHEDYLAHWRKVEKGRQGRLKARLE